jgi:hypothetical protein
MHCREKGRKERRRTRKHGSNWTSQKYRCISMATCETIRSKLVNKERNKEKTKATRDDKGGHDLRPPRKRLQEDNKCVVKKTTLT